jgi:hypothetical protein
MTMIVLMSGFGFPLKQCQMQSRELPRMFGCGIPGISIFYVLGSMYNAITGGNKKYTFFEAIFWFIVFGIGSYFIFIDDLESYFPFLLLRDGCIALLAIQDTLL